MVGFRHLSFVLVLVMLFSGTSALATQTDNRGIHAVPAPAKVAIDGKLNDWDLSGEVLICYDLETLRDVYSGRVSMMYDADNLYVAIHWKDRTPIGNRHDPRFEANRGWAGDSVQLRLKTDRISHLTMWQYAAKQEPAIQISYGKDLNTPFNGGAKQLYQTKGSVLDEGAEMAFLRDEDGNGYVQEIKLPWKLITLGDKEFKAGDTFACGIELLWGEADWPSHRYADNLAEGANSREFFWTAHKAWGSVWLEATGKLQLPPPAYWAAMRADEPQGPVEVKYVLPKDARVTVAIDDAAGHRVRNLIGGKDRNKGDNVERWDGLDDNGKAVPAGDYRIKGLYHDGIHVKWAMSFCNPGNPTWDSPDGRGAFYGDHTAPQAVATSGDYVALACPMGEAGKHLIGCDINGQRLWGLANRVAFDGGFISLATDGKVLWVALEGTRCIVYRVDIATGRYAPWQRTEKLPDGRESQVLDLVVTERAGAGKSFAAVAADPSHAAMTVANLTAIAYHDNTVAICLTQEDKVKILDSTTGDVKAERTIKAPRSVVFNADGTLVVLTEGKLVRIAADGKASPIGDQAWPEAQSVTRDRDGNLYVSVRGAEQNVKVVSPAGKLLREIGKKGGRPVCGPFDELAMRSPAQIAIDKQNRLWVTEGTENPKRTSIWALDGKFIRDLVGTTSYAAAGSINPDDPTMAFAEDTVFKIDLATGAWRPVWSLGNTHRANEIFPPHVHSITNRTITRDGIVYVYNNSSARGSSEVSCTIRDKSGVWRSAAFVGRVTRKPDGAYAKFMHPFFNGHDGELCAWADRNGDGLVQPEELAFAKTRTRSFYWGQLPDTDGTIAYLSDDATALVKLPIREITACGAPVYDVDDPQRVTLDLKVGGGGNGEGMILGGSKGRFYLNQNPLIMVEADGKVRGGYPNQNTSVHGSHTALQARAGYLIGPSSVLGTADMGDPVGEVFDLNGNLGENYLFTADGLWIQSLFKDTRGWFETPTQAVRGMPMDAITAGGESFGGNFVRTSTGKVYLTIGGTDSKVLEVTGLESIRRFEGSLTYTADQYAASQQLAADRAKGVASARNYIVSKAATAPSMNPALADWPALADDKQPAIDVQESPQRRFGRVEMRYDDANLYVAWRVFSTTDRMRNAGQDDRLLFKNGDCVDLMIGPAGGKADADNRRILMSVMQDKPVAVLYQKHVAGTPEKDRVAFSSPWRTIYFDRVTRPQDVKVKIAAVKGGYMVVATIPWQTLGVTPQKGLKLRADIGFLFADSGGTTTVSRQYWSNKATNLVNDVPGEADLTPSLWGEITLD